MNLLGPQHYGLLETYDQLRVLCGVFDKRKWAPRGWMNQGSLLIRNQNSKPIMGIFTSFTTIWPRLEHRICRSIWDLGNLKKSLWIHKGMGGLTKFGIPEKAIRINIFGEWQAKEKHRQKHHPLEPAVQPLNNNLCLKFNCMKPPRMRKELRSLKREKSFMSVSSSFLKERTPSRNGYWQ
ncbi:hypothetical protein PIB30_089916 [Stylosanthes scabra]|uniref:Uncharacterized protein n=1 Tax=Stylosanthes scabra TaxID=79078 RepID=A0ABU6WWZ3_9FABA|nr:hypothetical protein [Stylosanthes scabra]